MSRNQIWGRLLIFVAVAGLVATQNSGLRAQGADGRQHSACITNCNATRNACNDRCKTDCDNGFPDDKDARMACESECRGFSAESQKECNSICQQIKKAPTPEEP